MRRSTSASCRSSCSEIPNNWTRNSQLLSDYVDAAQTWKFTPALKDGRPVAVQIGATARLPAEEIAFELAVKRPEGHECSTSVWGAVSGGTDCPSANAIAF